MVYLAVYADDRLITSNTNDIEKVIEELSSKFALKNLGLVKHVISM